MESEDYYEMMGDLAEAGAICRPGSNPKTESKLTGTKYPIVAAAVLLLSKSGKILLTKRISKHANGKYGCPGGKIDFGEEIVKGIQREVLEETGLTVKCLPMSYAANCHYPKEGNHFLCLWFYAQTDMEDDFVVSFVEKDTDGKPKAEGWNWYSFDQLASMPMMPSTRNALSILQRPASAQIGFQIDEFTIED